MANSKISQLTSATTPLAGTETLPVVQSSSTKKVAVSDLTAGRSVSVGNLTVTTAATTATGSANINSSDPTVRYKVTGGTADKNTYEFRAIAAGTGFDYFQIRKINDAQTVFTELFQLTNDGNIVPSIAAKGVNFTANTGAAGKTSQLLNWYEEGTWTPTLTPSTSGSITLTSPTNSMRYTRVGRLVVLTGVLDVASVSSPVGDLRLTGIPFNIGGSSAGSISVYGLGTTSTATAYQILVDSGNTTTVFIRGYNAGNQVATVANNVQSGSGFYLTIQYIV